MIISVQKEDFDLTDISSRLCADRKDVGAIVTFSGLVRDQSADQTLVALELEHYPGMTEKALQDIADQAQKKWDIDDLAMIHRIGQLKPAENIVLVIVISAHRKQAFEACEFLMDYLKTQAPFWKKEITLQGEEWVCSKESDQTAADRWEK